MTTQGDPKPDGAAFDDFFESLGKKAEILTIKEQNSESKDVTNGVEPVDDDEQKVVDEIESLCMNCHENAS
jgi:zinc finger protein